MFLGPTCGELHRDIDTKLRNVILPAAYQSNMDEEEEDGIVQHGQGGDKSVPHRHLTEAIVQVSLQTAPHRLAVINEVQVLAEGIM